MWTLKYIVVEKELFRLLQQTAMVINDPKITFIQNEAMQNILNLS